MKTAPSGTVRFPIVENRTESDRRFYISENRTVYGRITVNSPENVLTPGTADTC